MTRGPQIEADFKAALKRRDELTVSCLRMVRAALAGKAKDLRRPLDEQEEIQTLKTLAKQRKDSAEQFQKGGRDDLSQRELAELAIIEGYLPAQMGEAEVAAVLDEVFEQLRPQGPKDMGNVMKAVMARLAGAADGKLVNQLVRQRMQAS